MINFVRDQLDAFRLLVVLHQPLDNRTTENSCSCSRVEDAKSVPLYIDPSRHEVGSIHRCEKETVFLAVPLAALRDVPLANSVGKNSGTLIPLGNRRASAVGLTQEAWWEHTVPYHEATGSVICAAVPQDVLGVERQSGWRSRRRQRARRHGQRLAQAMSVHAPRSSRYRFGGREDIDLEAAMRLMREMRQLDELINQVQVAERTNDLERIDRDLLKELLDDDAAESLDDLKKLLDALEEAGYIRPNGDKWELTPRGSRMIGQKALGEIYARLRRQSLGNHALPEEGRFGERLEQTKAYEFGDPFHLHMPRTIRKAIDRDGPRTPVRLRHEDFEIYRSELITSTATVMLVDLSWSMALRGSFQAAKKVALALHNLITSRFPKDSFHVIGFAAYAKELKAHDLPFLQWDEYVLGTNMQHALLLAERLLDKHNAGTKQIIMISDGEPTAHLENGRARFAYPPTPETYRATLRAVKRCTQKSIAINTFMLDVDYHLKAFMDAIARINGGRVFFTSPDKLGEYILVDYVQRKRKKLAH